MHFNRKLTDPPTERYKHWTQEEIKAVNYLLEHRDSCKRYLSNPINRTYVDPCLVRLPVDLDTVLVTPLWACRFGAYFILCAQCPNGRGISHWLMSTKGFKPLVHIEAWIEYEVPPSTHLKPYAGDERRRE